MAQGDEISFATGFQRAGSYADKGGLWFYKMTDLFPGHAWAVVGFYGHPKISYYRAKQVFAPQTVFAQYNNSFSLFPREEREVAFELADERQSLDLLAVRAWNADAVKTPQ